MTEKSAENQDNDVDFSEDGLRLVDGGKGLVVSRIGKSFNKRLSSTVGSEAWNSRDLKSRPH